MNFKKYILILICLIVSSVDAQIRDGKLQKLKELGLVDDERIERFDGHLTESAMEMNEIYIGAVFLSEFKKLTGVEYSITTTVDNGNEKQNEEDYKRLNSSLMVYLEKLKIAGLINEKQFGEQAVKIKNNDYPNFIEFFGNLSSQVKFEGWLNDNISHGFFEELYDNGVISNEKLNQLKLEVGNSELKFPLQVLNYCSNARIIDLSKFDNDPKIYLEQIHKLTSEVLPELGFTDFKFEISKDVKEATAGFVAHYVTVSLKSNGKVYKMKSFIDPDSTGKNLDYMGKLDAGEYFKIFNKILVDLQSPLRLHIVRANYGEGPGLDPYKQFAIIAMNQNQAVAFHANAYIFNTDIETFYFAATSDSIAKTIQEFKTLGLFSHLNESQISESVKSIEEKEIRDFIDVLNSFPQVIFSYDYELENGAASYAEIVKEYAAISHQKFNPTAIEHSFNEEKKNSVLSFKVNNVKYSTKLKAESDWIDTAFFEFMKKMAVKSKLPGQFYYLPHEGVNVIYLTPKQYKYIKERSLLNFSDD